MQINQFSIPFSIPEDKIDDDAAFVLRRLHRAGYEAYLVGGSVRDLLLGRKPKDFDVATSAAPDEIKELFGRCRLIGRRFRLAHIWGQKGRVIETATFRSKPKKSDGQSIIWDDNEFGTVESDALRRDFTVNALFYCLENKQILDFTGGLDDVEARLLRTIGDPTVRFREDPVRILRAIKFSARLGFLIEEQTLDAMRAETALLARAAIPRLYEELIRMMRGGAARQSISLMAEYGVLELLVPEIFALIPVDDDELVIGNLGPLLSSFDHYLSKKSRVPNSVALAVLFWPLIQSLISEGFTYRGPQHFRDFARHLLGGFYKRLAVPRKTQESLVALIDSHLRFHRIMSRRAARGSFSRTPQYREAFIFAEIRSAAGDLNQSTYAQWKALTAEFPFGPQVKKYRRGWKR